MVPNKIETKKIKNVLRLRIFAVRIISVTCLWFESKCQYGYFHLFQVNI